jgi:hypothetical protein
VHIAIAIIAFLQINSTSFRGRNFRGPQHIPPISRYRVVTFWLDRDTDDVTSGQSFHDFLAWAEEEDPLVEMPRDLHLAPPQHSAGNMKISRTMSREMMEM